MKILVPMAGSGQRFVDAGYKEPKPLIKVNGKRIIEYILDMYDPHDEFVFICNQDHLMNTDMRNVLNHLVPNCAIVGMPPHKLGPVYTVQAAYDHIRPGEQVIVSYCDNPLIWDYIKFKDYVRKSQVDGCILTHSGFHPHTLNNTKMAFVKEDLSRDGNFISEIKEKECYTNNPMNEHASTGIYYFKTGEMVKRYFDLAVKENVNYNGEYYVTLVYNLLLRDKLNVSYYDTPFVTVFGTPEEVQSFEAWAKILSSGQAKTSEDAMKCFDYWKAYHARR